MNTTFKYLNGFQKTHTRVKLLIYACMYLFLWTKSQNTKSNRKSKRLNKTEASIKLTVEKNQLRKIPIRMDFFRQLGNS